VNFKLKSSYEPRGDQPAAIDLLTRGLDAGDKHQVLLGVTGSGKTFTMARVIADANRPALVLAHNKTLAAQLYHEFKNFFPENAVEYFVSYYDFYQPEAYVPAADVYIEKESTINDELDKLRMSATRSLFERRDVIIVASVSCIYGIGSPDASGRRSASSGRTTTPTGIDTFRSSIVSSTAALTSTPWNETGSFPAYASICLVSSDPRRAAASIRRRFCRAGESSGSSAAASDADAGYRAWLEKADAEGRFKRIGEQYQQFIVHAVDERGDPITDYNLQLFRGDGAQSQIAEFDAEVDVVVHVLLVGELDIAADRDAASFFAAPVGGLHDPWPATGDHSEAALGQGPARGDRGLVKRIRVGYPGRTEDRHRRTQARERVKPFDELAQDAQHAPRVGMQHELVELVAIEERLVGEGLAGRNDQAAGPPAIHHRRSQSY